jgi:hypothetical protein
MIDFITIGQKLSAEIGRISEVCASFTYNPCHENRPKGHNSPKALRVVSDPAKNWNCRAFAGAPLPTIEFECPSLRGHSVCYGKSFSHEPPMFRLWDVSVLPYLWPCSSSHP